MHTLIIDHIFLSTLTTLELPFLLLYFQAVVVWIRTVP